LILLQAQPDLARYDTTAAVLFYIFALMAGGSAIAVVVSRNVVRMAVALLFTLAGVAGLYFLLNAEFLAAVQLVVYAGGTLILIVFGVMLTTKSPFSRFEPKLGEIVLASTMAIVLLTAMVMAVPLSETAERLGPNRLAAAFEPTLLPESLKPRVHYDGARLWFHGAMSDADRQDLTATIEAEYQDGVSRANEPLKNEDTKNDPAVQKRAADEEQALGSDRTAALAAVDALARRSQRYYLAEHRLGTGDNYPVALLGQKLLGDYLLPFEIASVLLLVVMIGAAYLAKGRRREEDAVARAIMERELSREARQWT
jgi:NADH-quinone oxidoreductase subunit J